MIIRNSFKTKMFEDFNKGRVSKIVYHGSGDDFNKFDQQKSRTYNDYYGGGVGYFTSSKEIARIYALGAVKHKGLINKKRPIIYTVYIDIKNIFDVNYEFTGKELTKLLPGNINKFVRSGGISNKHNDIFLTIAKVKSGNIILTGNEIFKGLSSSQVKSHKVKRYLERYNYDGLRYNGGIFMNTPPHSVYIVYNANNIRILKKEYI